MIYWYKQFAGLTGCLFTRFVVQSEQPEQTILQADSLFLRMCDSSAGSIAHSESGPKALRCESTWQGQIDFVMPGFCVEFKKLASTGTCSGRVCHNSVPAQLCIEHEVDAKQANLAHPGSYLKGLAGSSWLLANIPWLGTGPTAIPDAGRLPAAPPDGTACAPARHSIIVQSAYGATCWRLLLRQILLACALSALCMQPCGRGVDAEGVTGMCIVGEGGGGGGMKLVING